MAASALRADSTLSPTLLLTAFVLVEIQSRDPTPSSLKKSTLLLIGMVVISAMLPISGFRSIPRANLFHVLL